MLNPNKPNVIIIIFFCVRYKQASVPIRINFINITNVIMAYIKENNVIYFMKAPNVT